MGPGVWFSAGKVDHAVIAVGKALVLMRTVLFSFVSLSQTEQQNWHKQKSLREYSGCKQVVASSSCCWSPKDKGLFCVLLSLGL